MHLVVACIHARQLAARTCPAFMHAPPGHAAPPACSGAPAPVAPAPGRSPPRPHAGGSGSTSPAAPAARGIGQRWRSPLKLLEGALSKVADKAAEASGGARCAGCGGWLGVGAAVQALGQQWHAQCFRCAAAVNVRVQQHATRDRRQHAGSTSNLHCALLLRAGAQVASSRSR